MLTDRGGYAAKNSVKDSIHEAVGDCDSVLNYINKNKELIKDDNCQRNYLRMLTLVGGVLGSFAQEIAEKSIEALQKVMTAGNTDITELNLKDILLTTEFQKKELQERCQLLLDLAKYFISEIQLSQSMPPTIPNRSDRVSAKNNSEDPKLDELLNALPPLLSLRTLNTPSTS